MRKLKYQLQLLIKNQQGLLHNLLPLAVIVIIGVLGTGYEVVTHAAPNTANADTMDGQVWLIKSNDLAVLNNMGTYKWVACGLGTGPPYASTTGPCKPGQDPTYADYWTFKDKVLNGTQAKGSTVIFDDEIWTWTPKLEQEHQLYYEKLAGQLAAKYDISMVMTPFAKSEAGKISDDVTAAQYAPVVDIQSQEYDNHPSEYKAFVLKDVAAMHKVNKNVTILAGLATDEGGTPSTANNILQSYDSVKSYVQGFWLNANQWAPPTGTGCAPVGCPAVGIQFLEDIGISAPVSTIN